MAEGEGEHHGSSQRAVEVTSTEDHIHTTGAVSTRAGGYQQDTRSERKDSQGND